MSEQTTNTKNVKNKLFAMRALITNSGDILNGVVINDIITFDLISGK